MIYVIITSNKTLFIWHFFGVFFLYKIFMSTCTCVFGGIFYVIFSSYQNFILFLFLNNNNYNNKQKLCLFVCCCVIFIIYGASTNFWKCCSSDVSVFHNLLDCILLYPPTLGTEIIKKKHSKSYTYKFYINYIIYIYVIYVLVDLNRCIYYTKFNQ